MEEKIIIALVGMIGALLGGAIHAWASKNNQSREFAWKSKWELYASYFAAIGDLSFYDRSSEKHINALALMAQIRARIAIYGTPEVIRAVGQVFTYPDLTTDAAQRAMADAIAAMRADVGQNTHSVSVKDLTALMFNSRVER